jgi:hypothetical protein
MKVFAGAMGLVVALTLTVAAGAFAQMTPQGESSTDSMTTNNNGTNPTSTDPTPPPPAASSTPAAPPAPAADCPSEIEGMNAVLTALPEADRMALGGTGQLPAIPCDGYSYAADFTIVPDASASPTSTVPQSQEQPTQTVTTTQ